jgi:radical SAM protein with 4Fe4S-binding SPASM domain
MRAFEAEGCRILDDLFDQAFRKALPLQISLELTLRCNIRCAHCYNFDREAPRPGPSPELSFPEITRLLDDLRPLGTLFLSLTGGEAMVHPRFWDVMDEAAARAFAVPLLSNGTLLTDRACDRLAGYPNLWNVSLSVYGARASTHDAVTKSRGSFRRTMDGARRLRERGVAVSLKLIVMKSNAGEVAEMMTAAEDLDVPYSVNTSITGRYDGTTTSLATRVDAEALEALYRGPLRPFLEKGASHPTDDDFKCACARGNGAVSATGEVYPCLGAPLRAGSIREQPFGEIWRNSPVFRWIRGLRVSDFKSCAPCGLKAWCGRGPGAPTLLHGDYTGVDPWT